MALDRDAAGATISRRRMDAADWKEGDSATFSKTITPSGSEGARVSRREEREDAGSTGRLRIGYDEGRRVLLVDGVVVSVVVNSVEPPSGYWAAMLPDGSPRNALLLGLGGGTLAQLLFRRYPGIEIVGVDADRELIDFAREHFGLDVPGLEVVIGDAFRYVEESSRSFDFIAVDLFAGYDFQRGVLSKPFLRKLKAMAGRGGEVVFNLFKDKRTQLHLSRIERVMRMCRAVEAGKNVVLHCRGG
jgi:spermidine synthase